MAVLLFLPTVYPGIDVAWAALLLVWLAQRPLIRIYRSDVLAWAFVAGVILQTAAGVFVTRDGPLPWSPAPLGYVAILACLYLGRGLQPATVRWLLALFAIEAVVCVAQLVLRVPYIFPGQREAILNSGVTAWGSTDLLYFNRMYGLSTNSSISAQKFMLGLLLLYALPGRRRNRRVLAATLFAAGLYATFNRSTLLVVGCFVGLVALREFLRLAVTRQLWIAGLLGAALGAATWNWAQIENQFLRGNLDRSLVQESGRSDLWEAGLAVVRTHPLTGNLSQRVVVADGSEWFHLHNSWLQLVADHGLVGWLLILHSLSLVRRRNAVYFLVLALYSLVQFGLFGKISLLNVIFYYLMRKPAARIRRAPAPPPPPRISARPAAAVP